MLSVSTKIVINNLYNIREYTHSCERDVNLLFSSATILSAVCGTGTALITTKEFFEKILSHCNLAAIRNDSFSYHDFGLATISFSLLLGYKYSEQIIEFTYVKSGIKYLFQKLWVNLGKNLEISPPFHAASFEDLSKLLDAIEDFEAKQDLALVDEDEEIANDNHQENFLKYLKKSCKVDELLLLHKLGADYQDCYLAVFEEVDANRMTKGRNSLLWMTAKKVNKHRLSLPENAPDYLKQLITINKKYCAVKS